MTVSAEPYIFAQRRERHPAGWPVVAILALLAVAMLPAVPEVAAQTGAPATDKITLELNNAQDTDSGSCRLSVVATSHRPQPVDALGVEVVAFNADGLVDQFLRLDFPRMTPGRTRVLQFDLAGKRCETISRLLVNDVLNCAAPGEGDIHCADLLETSNRTAITFGN